MSRRNSASEPHPLELLADACVAEHGVQAEPGVQAEENYMHTRGKKRYKCQHAKSKYRCQVCSPHLFCIHGLRKVYCMDCTSNAVEDPKNKRCEHHKMKRNCHICTFALQCKHGTNKYSCHRCKKARRDAGAELD